MFLFWSFAFYFFIKQTLQQHYFVSNKLVSGSSSKVFFWGWGIRSRFFWYVLLERLNKGTAEWSGMEWTGNRLSKRTNNWMEEAMTQKAVRLLLVYPNVWCYGFTRYVETWIFDSALPYRFLNLILLSVYPQTQFSVFRSLYWSNIETQTGPC